MDSDEPRRRGRSGLGASDGLRLLRLALGLLVGFVGAYVTLQAIDRFGGDETAEPLELVLGDPDVDAFCRRDDRPMRAVSTSGDAFGWECAGLVERLWTTESVSIGNVCRWQYGVSASERLVDPTSPDGWRCVTDP